ncbi:hypothetical protein BJ166DRAFT_51283 [Pestalotiopsis sp. NC0098]|nr:hypothetical protein BJ166DRAFT_51283 [Pestalotiopsis sp. NC0098]
MLSVSRTSPDEYLYPIGNTPAVSLTEDLPPHDRADILLLGCGDIRHILFTAHFDRISSRKLDITCNDNERHIIARNVLILTLIIDGPEKSIVDAIWSIQYHLILSCKEYTILKNQAEKLHGLSQNWRDWERSKYGKQLRFCD